MKKLKKKYPLIVMQKLQDPVYDLDLLGSKGKYVYHVLRRRINSRDPNSGHLIETKKLWLKTKKLAQVLIKKFNLDGLYDCDLMLDNKKRFNILEINPRMSGSIAICRIAGIPILEYLVDLTLGKKLNVMKKIPTYCKVIL